MLTLEIKRQFLDLASQLSPENLHCDGEITRAQAMTKKRKLDKQWAALEKQIGYSVDEEQAYKWSDEISAADKLDRQASMLLQPQNALVHCSNPGVWARKGANGMSAYYIQNPSLKGSAMFRGIDLNASAANEFILYSEFAQYIDRKEQVGVYGTLDEAVHAGESYLAGVNEDTLRAALPNYRPENLVRLLDRLPAA